MDEHDATEVAYKNGYEKGKKDAVKWIHVTERLPEKFVDVIVFRNGKISIDYCEEDGFFAYDFTAKKVTHWMPLPDAPKDLDNENKN